MKNAVDSFETLLKCRTSTNKAGFDFWDPKEGAWVQNFGGFSAEDMQIKLEKQILDLRGVLQRQDKENEPDAPDLAILKAFKIEGGEKYLIWEPKGLF